MRLIIAKCSVDYEGRLGAHLPEATRLIMVKADGCVAIHADGGAYKPLNWMNAPNQLSELDGVWAITNPKGEKLTITIHELIADSSHDLGLDPGLNKDGVEAHLQELLAANPEVLGEGFRLVQREYHTDVGPVDLLCRDAQGRAVAVEIKRKGELAGVDQLTRYLEFLNKDPALAPVQGIFAAQEIRPQARTLSAERGIRCQEIDYDLLRGIQPKQPKLF